MKRYYVHLTVQLRRSQETIKHILWSNGGVGYTKQELESRVIPKINADDRVRSYRVEER